MCKLDDMLISLKTEIKATEWSIIVGFLTDSLIHLKITVIRINLRATQHRQRKQAYSAI